MLVSIHAVNMVLLILLLLNINTQVKSSVWLYPMVWLHHAAGQAVVKILVELS